jgi:hypothetical protein
LYERVLLATRSGEEYTCERRLSGKTQPQGVEMAEDETSGGVGKSRLTTFFTTLPGILTGIAALVTAVATLIGVFATRDGGVTTDSGTTSVATIAGANDPREAPNAPPGAFAIAIGDTAGTYEFRVLGAP